MVNTFDLTVELSAYLLRWIVGGHTAGFTVLAVESLLLELDVFAAVLWEPQIRLRVFQIE